jgi:histidinol-phosphate/aromatic aminotransferase/cobyric acid decarboxylase-like protein
MVKYIAKSAAKNISSEDNHTMVPTLTKFGRLAGVRGTTAVSDADVTRPLLRHPVGEGGSTP